MAEDTKATSPTATQGLNIPDEVQKKFPELIGLIKKSQSMNDEERQYWIDVLPIMTDDQIDNLRSILDNEKKQLEEADKQYEDGMQTETKHFHLEFNEIKYKEEKRIREQAEKVEEAEEAKKEQDVLAELAKL
jgi:hypothetical protein